MQCKQLRVNSNHLCFKYSGARSLAEVMIEMDRILRPEGTVIIRDTHDNGVYVSRFLV